MAGRFWHRVSPVQVPSSLSFLGFLGTKLYHEHSPSNTWEWFGLSCHRQGHPRNAEMAQVCSSSFFSQCNGCSITEDTLQNIQVMFQVLTVGLLWSLQEENKINKYINKAISAPVRILLFSSNMFSFIQANHIASSSLYFTASSFPRASVLLYYLYGFLTSSL